MHWFQCLYLIWTCSSWKWVIMRISVKCISNIYIIDLLVYVVQFLAWRYSWKKKNYDIWLSERLAFITSLPYQTNDRDDHWKKFSWLLRGPNGNNSSANVAITETKNLLNSEHSSLNPVLSDMIFISSVMIEVIIWTLA